MTKRKRKAPAKPPKPPSRQSLWITANRKAGRCGCGRKPKHGYRQCPRCLAVNRKRLGYKGRKYKRVAA